jgi:hypothetical protein
MKALTVMAALLIASGAAFAQQHLKPAKALTMSGYLVDAMCGKNMVKAGPEKAMIKAKKHTRACGLDEGCAASGYGLVSGGKFYPFDASGNAQAGEYLKNTKKENNIEVTVLGAMSGDVMKVERIADAPAKK